jgi:anti-anti-sigma factor
MGRRERATAGNEAHLHLVPPAGTESFQTAPVEDTVAIHVRLASVEQPSVIEVAGEIDMATAPMVVVAVNELLDGGASVVVDLSEVTFLGSAGLAGLIEVTNHARDRRLGLAIVANQPPVVRPMEVTGLLRQLPTCASVGDALRRLA